MHFANFLALATFAIAPAAATALRGRGDGGSCTGDQQWVGWTKSCVCPNKGCDYDSHLGKCHYPTHPQPPCGYGEMCYCARSSTDYCEYDGNDERCWDDGSTQVFCCAPSELPTKLPEVCPPGHPECPTGQHWDYASKQCECEAGKVWLNNECCFPPLPKPSCSYGQQAYCAKDQTHWCAYDQNNDYCQDDGHNTAFCCAEDEVQNTCDQKWG